MRAFWTAVAEWGFGWTRSVDWSASATWLYGGLMVLAFLWVTRSPELRVRRLRLGAALLLLLWFWMATRARNPIYMMVGLVLVRPVMFLVGAVWSEVVGHYVGEAITEVTFGSDFGRTAPKVSYALPRHFRATKRPRLAIRLIERKLREKPEDFEGLLLLASIHAEDRRDLAAAAKVVKRALRADEVAPSHKSYLAVQYETWRRQLDPALKPLAVDERLWKAVSAHHHYAEARRLLAAGRLAEAAASAEAELKKNPEDVEGLYLLARLHGECRRDPKAAERWVQKILDLDYTPSGYREFAQAMLQTWRDTANLPPADAVFRPELTQPAPLPTYDSARRLAEGGHLGTAVQHVEQALQRDDPDDFEGLFLLATIQAEKCGNLKAAARVVERIESTPKISNENKMRAVAKLKEWKAAARALPGSTY